MITTTALMCLALNVYHESRGEPQSGQVAVAKVTMNRAQGKEKNVCKAVFAPHQFSWTTGATHKGKVKDAFIPRKDDKAWQQAKAVAKLVAIDFFADPTRGANHYHAKSVKPDWSRSKSMVKVAVIGQHIFYKDRT